MARFVLHIDLDNAAFEDEEALPDLFRALAPRLITGPSSGRIRDTNGHMVGSFAFVDTEGGEEVAT